VILAAADAGKTKIAAATAATPHLDNTRFIGDPLIWATAPRMGSGIDVRRALRFANGILPGPTARSKSLVHRPSL
jgi:hypothetical protein